MELSANRTIDDHINKGKSLEQLTPAEQKQFIGQAIAEKDKFVAWAEKQQELDTHKSTTLGSKISESWKNAPSKKLLTATLSAVGLSNIGLAIAGSKVGLSKGAMADMWVENFGLPVLEELVFRSRHIPNFLTWAGKQVGLEVSPNVSRLGGAAIFSVGHDFNYTRRHKKHMGVLNFAQKGTMGLLFNKVSSEHGISASVSAHALFNTLGDSVKYMWDFAPNYRPLWLTIFLARQASEIGIGIIGIKEALDDKRINDTLKHIRTAESSGQSIDMEKEFVDKLLKNPSTDGYKFQAGVELAYVNAALTMPDMLKDVMTPDEYARTQVHKMVTGVWKDSKTLPHRLEKANSYITEQIAARNAAS